MPTEPFRYWLGDSSRYDRLIGIAERIPRSYQGRLTVCPSSPGRQELAERLATRVFADGLDVAGIVRWCKAMGWGPELVTYRTLPEWELTVHCRCRAHFIKRPARR